MIERKERRGMKEVTMTSVRLESGNRVLSSCGVWGISVGKSRWRQSLAQELSCFVFS
jgi:hypothetical protein